MKNKDCFRKLDKRQCRKYMSTSLPTIDADGDLIYDSRYSFLLSTCVKRIGKRIVLIIYFYPAEKGKRIQKKPKWVLFQGKQDYTTLDFGLSCNGHFKSACLRNLDRELFAFCAPNLFCSDFDAKNIRSFCQGHSEEGVLECIFRKQFRIMEKRRRRRKLLEQKEMKEIFHHIPQLPRKIKGWAQKNIIPAYLFYTYLPGQKESLCRCSSCGRESVLFNIRYNKITNCPHCNRRAILKTYKRCNWISGRDTLQVVQKINARTLIIRYLKIEYLYRQGELREAIFRESARTIIECDAYYQIQAKEYYNSYKMEYGTSWKKGIRPTFLGNYTFESSLTGHLYTANLKNVLSGTPWQYSGIRMFYQGTKHPFPVEMYLRQYIKYPFMEYLIKMRLYRLVEDMIYDYYLIFNGQVFNLEGKNAIQILGVPKKELSTLQAIDPNFLQFKLFRAIIKQCGFFQPTLFSWCLKYRINGYEEITVPLQYMTRESFMKYATDQYEKNIKKDFRSSGLYYSMSQLLKDYRDYLIMADALGVNMKSSSVLFPRELKKAHDFYCTFSIPNNLKLYNGAIQKLYLSQNSFYSFSDQDFFIRLPECVQEICNEGAQLHHCVQTYIKPYIRRECILLFLREKAYPDKPLCTVEIRNGKIRQVRGFDNMPPSPSVQNFLKRYERWILKRQYTGILQAS